MCRIAGMVNFELPSSALQAIVKEMCDRQRHGGPDDEGIYTSEDGRVVLGNRRLALVDLSPGGHQPMHYRERFSITYNGELYNFNSLKQELKSLGHHFANLSDTEVILAAFAEWDTQSFERLEGMFAFALYDKLKGFLYLVRDPAGIKPLYYSLKNQSLLFASEVRAFDAVSFSWKPNNNWPVYLMAYGHLPEPLTTFEDIHSLHKGSFLAFDVNSQSASFQSFSHFSFTKSIVDSDSASLQLQETLSNSVNRHLLADAPVGVFLSGGLDSGIITRLAHQYKKENLITLSIYFDEEEFSEKKYQDLIIGSMGCRSFQYLLSKDDFDLSFPQILNAMDLPGCDGINTWFISRFASQQGLKAVLSGIGADELFGGYPSFSRMHTVRLVQHIPDFALRLKKRSGLKALNRISYLGMDGIKGIYLFLRGHFNAFEIAKHLDGTEREIWEILEESPFIGDVEMLDNKNQASWMEFNLYMQNQLLRDADVMSMANSLEIRVPFLDTSLIKLAMRMAPECKYSSGRPKKILIDSFGDFLPKEVWNRPKMGFSFPFSQWLVGNDYVSSLMEEGGASSRGYYKKFKDGHLHWSQLMSLINIRHRGYA